MVDVKLCKIIKPQYRFSEIIKNIKLKTINKKMRGKISTFVVKRKKKVATTTIMAAT